MKKITVIGGGYVGMSIGTLLSQNNEVVILDVDQNKVDKINEKKSPIEDEYIEEYLSSKELKLSATLNPEEMNGSELVFISTPTNYDPKTNKFDTTHVGVAIEQAITCCPDAVITIKSTVPIGYTKGISKKYPACTFVFMPEFLREGKALYDNLYPSRIVVGYNTSNTKDDEKVDSIVEEFEKCALSENIPTIKTGYAEAESVKLFANTYLAMRISYFNELDTYAESNNLKTRDIIDGMSYDPRIGGLYNNPSFGYGGYCLPKDTQQLAYTCTNTSSCIIDSITKSNNSRKDFIAAQIVARKPKIVGIYRLVMKTGSDNFREAAIFDVIEKIRTQDTIIVIYEPNFEGNELNGILVMKKLDDFKNISELIVANRIDSELSDVCGKVYSRDLYLEN